MNSVRVFNAHRKHRIHGSETLRVVRRVLKGERCADAELNVVFVNDKQMIRMNRTYLRHDYTTDVLSFLYSENGKKNLDGEVYVNVDQAKRQSAEYRVTLANELRRLVAHGVLHLLGYTDETKRKRNMMTVKEDRYLQI